MEMWSKIEHWTYYISSLDTPSTQFEYHEPMVALWNDKRHGTQLPAWSDFELEDFKGWWGWITVVDCLSPDGDDWVYRLWGSEVARFTGHEMTGKAMKAKQSDDVVDVLHYNDHDFDHMKLLYDEKKIGLLEGPVNTEIPNLNWVSINRLPLANDGSRVDKFLNAVSPRKVPLMLFD